MELQIFPVALIQHFFESQSVENTEIRIVANSY